MKRLFAGSFRRRLFAALLAVSLVPVLICSALLLQVFRLRMTDTAETENSEQLTGVLLALDEACRGFETAAEALRQDPVVLEALDGSGLDTQLYGHLFTATEGLRGCARFDLYDSQGRWRYSTQNAPAQEQLPTDWGVLYAASSGAGELVYSASADASDLSLPLLRGACVLPDGEGETVGYLLVSMGQEDFRGLLESRHDTGSSLFVLSPYWRPVYCSQPNLAQSVVPMLRGRLLSGKRLDAASDGFLYGVARHEATGLYAVLRRPNVFTGGTVRLLYTVSAFSALVGVLVSVLISLRLSRRLFRPIGRLHQAIAQVGRNDLDVRVPDAGNDELGELARQFNAMVIALRRNQEELVENQQELNEAQIRMLQAQLNPHFLCNTLDTMKWISKINQVPQVAVMSTDLADILRFCISPDEFVPLRREIEILERYTEIQRIRLSGAFTLEVDVPGELQNCPVPKMILQPIAENAILHGLEGVENGSIRVNAAQRDGVLEIAVSDNGRGLPEDMKGPFRHREQERDRGHLGLYNVHTILQKHYGERFGLYLEDGPDGRGAMVRATLPLCRGEESKC